MPAENNTLLAETPPRTPLYEFHSDMPHGSWDKEEGCNCSWIDETGFNLYLQRSYGRAEIGRRCNRIIAGSEGRNIMSIAMNPSINWVLTTRYQKILQDGVNVKLFHEVSPIAVFGDDPEAIFMY